MKSVFKPLLLACILASVGVNAFSQAPGMGPGAPMMGSGGPMHEGMGHPGMGRTDPARMQARMERRQAVLKAELKLTPAQEGAWAAFTAALKPPTGLMGKRPDIVELAKLTTPQRIDQMKALHTQHQSEMNTVMDKRAEATKVFYGALTAEQQKVFDAATIHLFARAGHVGGPRDARGPT